MTKSQQVEAGPRGRRELSCALNLCQRLTIHSLPNESLSPKLPQCRKLRKKLDGPLRLTNCIVSAACQIEPLGNAGSDDRRERVQFLRFSELHQGLTHAVELNQRCAKPLVASGIVRIQLDSAP